MKALLISAGSNMQSFWCIHNCYWVLPTAYNLNSLGRRGHLFDYTCAVIIYEMCIEEPTATVSVHQNVACICWNQLFFLLMIHIITIQVTKVTPREKPKYPPHPLSTIELEKRASRYFRMSSERTMKVSKRWESIYFIVGNE